MVGFVRIGKRRGRIRLLTPVLYLLFALGALGVALPAAADTASPWFVTDQGRVRLVAGVNSVGGADTTVPLGLEFDLKPHWKIYWRSPGDAGYPPRIDWVGSGNLRAAKIAWPAPRRFAVLGLQTVGYEGHVVLPIAASVAQPGRALDLRAALSYLTCNDVCIPYDTKLALALPAGDGAPSGDAGLIARFVAREPSHQQTPALSLREAAILPGSHPELELRVAASPPLSAPDAFVEANGIEFGAPQIVSRDGDETVMRIAMTGPRARRSDIAGERFDVTLVDGDRALETAALPRLGVPVPDFAFFTRMIGIALLGGLILNVMPCVLPVLSLKLLGIAGTAGRERRRIRSGLLASAAGVIAAFLVLALATVALRAGGVAVGWGIQFQQPLFLIFVMAVVTLFAANLWGLFEVPLPSAVAQWGGADRGRGLIGNFAAGAFATLLATPCSAPFVGTAVGFALAAGAATTLAIFVAMGVGLAFPYLAIAAAPFLVAWLPRPGRWTILLRQILGVALAATGIWLAWVLSEESGAVAAIAATVLMIAVPVALYLLRHLQARGAAVAALVALAFLIPAALPPPPRAAQTADGFWRPFDPAAIQKLVSGGNTVFVDVTAEWCLTCKLNERVAIDTPSVRRRLSAAGVVAMRADWTRPSGEIERYLHGFGRYGIPFNAVYGPALPEGRALPELLTPDEVAAALDQSRKGG
ncbi:MAG TPA: protein-disulfide reductase DsbD domain-containing protein [Stellaceae bacterium]|nr:protein-disulfide reductase DsbD domain-containing protein [Stellaceae bacterium]